MKIGSTEKKVFCDSMLGGVSGYCLQACFVCDFRLSLKQLSSVNLKGGLKMVRFIDIPFGKVFRYKKSLYTKSLIARMLVVYLVFEKKGVFCLYENQIGTLPLVKWEPYDEFEVVGELSRED